MLTKQDIFTKVSTHLLTQMEKSVDEHRNCAYRSNKGKLQCSIGCLIADEDYSINMEGGVPNLDISTKKRRLISTALDKAGIPRTEEIYDFLVVLQNIHDGHDPRIWRFELTQLANGESLDFPPYTE